MSLQAAPRQVLDLLFDLSRATRCCQQEAVFCEDLTFTQFHILDLVAQAGSLRLAELHPALRVEKSTTTRLLEPLLERGFLAKTRLAADARALELRLTPAGQEVYARVSQCVGRFASLVEAEIPEERRAEVYAAVRILLTALQTTCAARCAVTNEKES